MSISKPPKSSAYANIPISYHESLHGGLQVAPQPDDGIELSPVRDASPPYQYAHTSRTLSSSGLETNFHDNDTINSAENLNPGAVAGNGGFSHNAPTPPYKPRSGDLTDDPYMNKFVSEHEKFFVDPNTPHTPTKRKRRRWPLILGILGGIALLAIALGVGLGVGLSRKNSSASASPTTSTSSSPSPSSTSTSPASTSPLVNVGPAPTITPSSTGAWAGTGLAALTDGFYHNVIYLFYQTFNGQINSISWNGTVWSNKQSMNITDAASGTGLATYAMSYSGSVQGKLFYVTHKQIISNVLWDYYTPANSSGGAIAKNNFAAPSARRIGMAGLYNSSVYASPNSSQGGDRLYAGGTDGIIHEYEHDQQSGNWIEGYNFAGSNGYASINLHQGGIFPAGTTNALEGLLYQNANNTLEYSYKNPGTGATANWADMNWNFTPVPSSNSTSDTGFFVGPYDLDATIFFPRSGDNLLTTLGYSGTGTFTTFGTPQLVQSNGQYVQLLTGSDMAGTISNGQTHIFLQTQGNSIAHLSGHGGSLTFQGFVPV